MCPRPPRVVVARRDKEYAKTLFISVAGSPPPSTVPVSRVSGVARLRLSSQRARHISIPFSLKTRSYISLSTRRSMPAGKRGGSSASPFSRRKEGASSPRRREALKRFVSLVKRKGGGGKRAGGLAFAAGFRLLHVDVFQASGCFYVFIFLLVYWVCACVRVCVFGLCCACGFTL